MKEFNKNHTPDEWRPDGFLIINVDITVNTKVKATGRKNKFFEKSFYETVRIVVRDNFSRELIIQHTILSSEGKEFYRSSIGQQSGIVSIEE